MVYWRCWFRIQTQIFEISTLKFTFGQIWAQKLKVVRFVWKLVHIVSQGCWFRIQIYIFEISTPKSIFGQFGPKIQSSLFSLKIGTHSISRMLISSPDIGFRNFDPKIHLEANLGPKSQRCPFCLKNGTHGISSMLILIPNYFSEFQILISFLGKFGPKKVKVVRFNWKLVHMLSWKCRFRIRT